MKTTLEFILNNLVDHPDEIVVTEHVSEEERKTILSIRVNAEDIGKIIGKQGRIIHAIRDIIKLIAAKHEEYVDVVIEEESEAPAAA